MKVVSTQNLTIIKHNGNYYCVTFVVNLYFISKKDAYNLIKNAAKDTFLNIFVAYNYKT